MTKGQEQLAALQRDIGDRLRPVCQGMSESSFEQLVRDIAAVKLKYGAESDASESVRIRVRAAHGESELQPQ
ncbi:MAG: hypothetical protein ABIR58_07630 [Gemmatimonadaceae bacterium]